MPEDNHYNEWLESFYNNSLCCFDPEEELNHYNNLIKLFNNPEILNQYKPGKVENLLLRAASDFSTSININYPPLEIKLKLVKSCYALFQNWFAKQSTPSEGCFMFWDAMIGRPNFNKNMSNEELVIYEAFYDCLKYVLSINNKNCQLSALHGLNHLKDKRIPALLDNFISNCKDKELVEYASQAKNHSCL